MLRFALDDLTVEGLQKIAAYYGISTQGERAQLSDRIQQRMAAKAQISFGELSQPWWKNPSVLVAFVAALIAASAMFATWYNATTAANNLERTLSKDMEERRQDKVRNLQRVIVYSIIEEGTKRTDKGVMTLEEIKNRYIATATVVEGVDLKKSELQPMSLRLVLIDLMSAGLVYQTFDDTYAIQRSLLNPRVDRFFIEEQAKYTILHLLSTEGGKYTILELGQVVIDKLKITNEEFNLLVNQLIAANAIVIAENQKVWSAANKPRPSK